MGEPKATQEEECIKRNPIMPRKGGGSVRRKKRIKISSIRTKEARLQEGEVKARDREARGVAPLDKLSSFRL